MPSTYLAPQGAIWDWISWKVWGDEQFVAPLIRANPRLRHITRFDEPTMLNIPDKPVVPASSPNRLPPWKQGGSNAS